MLRLKDLFKIDFSSKGGGKLYKKIMRKYNIPIKDVKEVKQQIAECSSNSDNYGYYDISLIIRAIPNEDGAFKPIAMSLASMVNSIEITATFLMHYTAGIFACTKCPFLLLFDVSNIESMIDNENAKVYIKVDENDTNYKLRDIDENKLINNYTGTLIDRFVAMGQPKEQVESLFIKISKEEYEKFAKEVSEHIYE